MLLLAAAVAALAPGWANADTAKLKMHIELQSSTPPAGAVIIHNVGASEVGLWRTGNSWGDPTLSFELVSGGRKHPISWRPRDYTFNFPIRDAVVPGDSYRIEFNLGDRNRWLPAWSLVTAPRGPATLIAIYTVPASADTAKHNVWTGTLRSPAAPLSYK